MSEKSFYRQVKEIEQTWIPFANIQAWTKTRAIVLAIFLPLIVHHIRLHLDMIKVYNDRGSDYHRQFADDHAGMWFILPFDMVFRAISFHFQQLYCLYLIFMTSYIPDMIDTIQKLKQMPCSLNDEQIVRTAITMCMISLGPLMMEMLIYMREFPYVEQNPSPL
eukprot:UN25155